MDRGEPKKGDGSEDGEEPPTTQLSDMKKTFSEVKVSDYINTDTSAKMMDASLLGLTGLLGAQVSLPNLNSTPKELVKAYMIFIYVMSVLNGLKDVSLSKLTHVDPNEPDTELNKFIKDRILKMMNAGRPITMFKKLMNEDKQVEAIFDHKVRFWMTRGGKRMVYDTLSDEHFPVIHYPYQLFKLLLEEITDVESNTFVKEVFTKIENLSELLFEEEYISRAEFTVIIVIALNMGKNSKGVFNILSTLQKVQLIKEKMEVIKWTMEEANEDVHKVMEIFYTYTVVKKDKYQGYTTAFKLFVDLLVSREDLLINWKNMKNDNFWSKLGYNQAGIVRCIRYNMNEEVIPWEKMCDSHYKKHLNIVQNV